MKRPKEWWISYNRVTRMYDGYTANILPGPLKNKFHVVEKKVADKLAEALEIISMDCVEIDAAQELRLTKTLAKVILKEYKG